jgi:hypothetical protein
MRPGKLIVGLAVVVVGVVVLSSLLGGGSEELKFVAPADERGTVDLDPAGASLGDLTVFSGQLLDEDGDPAGRHDGTCTLTSRASDDQERRTRCVVTLTIGTDNGETELQLAAVGRAQADDVLFSVVGGTNEYAGASGQALFDYGDRDRPRISVDLDD